MSKSVDEYYEIDNKSEYLNHFNKQGKKGLILYNRE